MGCDPLGAGTKSPYRTHRSAPALTFPLSTPAADTLRSSSAAHAEGVREGGEGKEEEHISSKSISPRGHSVEHLERR